MRIRLGGNCLRYCVELNGAGGLRQPLARQGVLVRDCASFGLPGTIRVAVPDEEGRDRLAAALARVAGSYHPRP